MWQPIDILNVFNTLTLKQTFWKTRTFFKKMENCFLAEGTRIEKKAFPYKTALSEANIMKNRMKSTKRTFHKEQNFASNYLV